MHTQAAQSARDKTEGVKQEKEGKETKSLVSLAVIKAQVHTPQTQHPLQSFITLFIITQ